MVKKAKEFMLNTPEKYWVVIFGHHLHKSFWGVLLFVLGLIAYRYDSVRLGIFFLVIGILLVVLSITGHIYTQNKPYFKLWDKYKKNQLIPSDIGKDKKRKAQKEAWDSLWKNKQLQGFLNFTRHCAVAIYLSTILKGHRNAPTFCELGCGSSILLTKLSKTANTIVGIDYSQESLARSRELFRKQGVKNLRLIKDDVRKLRTKERFDVVFSNGLIEHFDNPGEIIKNHLKITKKNGYTIIIVPHKYIFKHLYYLITKPAFMKKLKVYPDQIFFTKKSLEKTYKKYCAKYNYDYKIQLLLFTEDVVLIVHKK